jgi:hypothetical protein
MHLFSVWHHRLFDELLSDLSEEDRQAIVCFGVNEVYPKEYNPNFNYNIMYEYNLPFYESNWQKHGYCQTSCMYHIYNNREHLKAQKPDCYSSPTGYIGFMQYDMKVDKDAFAYWKGRIAAATAASTSPATRLIFHEITIPTITGFRRDRALETHALAHYNDFFGTNVTAREIVAHPKCRLMPVVHTFIIPIDMFEKMMSWMTVYMKLAEATFATTGKYPFNISQAEYFEIVHGLFLVIECMQDNTCMEPISKLRHIWPMYHDKTLFENYKVHVTDKSTSQ